MTGDSDSSAPPAGQKQGRERTATPTLHQRGSSAPLAASAPTPSEASTAGRRRSGAVSAPRVGRAKLRSAQNGWFVVERTSPGTSPGQRAEPAPQPMAAEGSRSTVASRVTSPGASDDESMLDVRSLRRFAGYVSNSVTERRRALFLATFTIGVFLTTFAVQVAPRTYQARGRILTHRSVGAALAQPHRPTPHGAEDSTRGAAELIHSQESLNNIIDELGLQMLAPQGLVGGIWQWAATPERDAGKDSVREAVLERLRRSLRVDVEGDVIAVVAEWSSPEAAKRMAETALALFLDKRRNMEIGEIVETATILEESVATSARSLEEATARLQATARRHHDTLGAPPQPWAAPPGRAAQEPAGSALASPQSEQLRDVRARLDQIRQAQQRSLQEAEQRLGSLRVSLGPHHPDVIAARRELELRSAAPEGLAELHAQQTRLLAELEGSDRVQAASAALEGAEATIAAAARYAGRATRASAEMAVVTQRAAEDVRQRQESYNALLERLANVRLQLDTASAVFSYRYLVTETPNLPLEATGPSPAVRYGLGVCLALMLAMFIVVATDVLAGRIVEAWQIERFLGVAVLAQVEDL